MAARRSVPTRQEPTSLLAALPEAALIVATDGAVTAANAAAEKLLGERPASIAECLPAGLPQSGIHEGTATRSDGSTFAAELALGPLEGGAKLLVMRDITGQLQTASQLEDAERIAHVGSWTWHIPSGAVTWSPELYRLFGRDPEKTTPTFDLWLETVHPEDREWVADFIHEALEAGRDYDFEHRILTPAGEVHSLHCRGQLVRDEQGKPLRLVGVSQDISDRVHQQAEMNRIAAQREAVLDAAAEGVCGVDLEGRVTFANPAAAELFGTTPAAFRGESLPHRLPADERARLLAAIAAGEPCDCDDLRLRRDDGTEIPVAFHCRPLREGSTPIGSVLTFLDTGERRRYEAQLRFLADHDALTGLMNRRRFEEEVATQAAFIASYGGELAVMVLDLDHFKDVNDTRGHGPGDELLRSVGQLLGGRLSEAATLARLGGDEFAVLLPSADATRAAEVAEELREAVAGHVMLIGGRRLQITASIGVATVAADDDGTQALADADVAMYQAKDSGRNAVAPFSAELGGRERMEQRLTWSGLIRDAIDHASLQLFAQPIIAVRNPMPGYRFELLLRMPGPGGGLVPPEVFLPVAERHGLVGELDHWVINEAVRLAAAERAAGRETILEVNLSGRSMADERLPRLVSKLLAETGASPGQLVFEVTETAAIDSLHEARELATNLLDLGCGFAIDDFGAGFGSFAYLKHLPSQYVKIDGEFVRRLPSSATDQLVVRAITELAHGMGKLVVAEFVEDRRTIELLREFRIDFAQGHFVGHPAPASELLGVSRRSAPQKLHEDAAGE